MFPLRTGLLLALLTLAGFALRLPLLMRFPLREDEAIYGYWALHAYYVDPLFLHVWPDKPPIFLWVLAAAQQLWGHDPDTAGAAMRLVNIMASTATIPVLAACARRWWGAAAALITALLAALNPFAISFAPTAYTDPLLVLAGSLALSLAVRRRWFWSGLWLGIAVMTKQQGLLFAPLVAVGALCSPLPGAPRLDPDRRAPPLRALLGFLGGLALVVAPILCWDSLRWAVAPSPWDLGAANAGGVAMLPPAAWPARLGSWRELLAYLLVSPWVWTAYSALLLSAAAAAWRRCAPARTWLPALLLAAWAAGFVLLHTAASVQVWDRYLLPLIIPATLLGGWAAAELGRLLAACSLPAKNLGRRHVPISLWVGAGAAAGLLLLIGPAVEAAQGGLPIGGDHGDYEGLDEALAAVNTPHALLFHRELGWHARFALFDAMQRGEVELRYYPSAVYLADSAAKSPHQQRFVILPDWAPLPELPVQLAARRLHAHIHLRSGRFTVYRLDELPAPDASWRVCSAPPFRADKLRQLLPHEQDKVPRTDDTH